METLEDKKTTFLEVERLFKDEMRHYPAWLRGTFNICCTPEQQIYIIETGDTIKSIEEFSTLSFSDIYFVLIYVYYSLHFNEQTTDWLYMQFFIDNTEDPELCVKLYMGLAIGDIMINELNFSSAVRRHIFGMSTRGGKSKRNKTKRNRRKRNKSKRNKTKKYTAKKYTAKKI